jgi:hemerythrin-like domain-containing protein
MKPTDILSSEHRVIEQVLDCLDKMIQTCQLEHKFDEQSAKDAVDFFRNFADRCHHGRRRRICFRPWKPRASLVIADQPA